MSNGPTHGMLIKKLHRKLLHAGPRPNDLQADSILEYLMLAVLSENTSISRAKSALRRLLENTIDLNDLRVSTPEELVRLIEPDIPDAASRAAVLIQILNSIYDSRNNVTLEGLKKDKKSLRAYLDSLEGMTPYVAAFTLLWGFGLHAVPVDEVMLTVFKKESLIDPAMDVGAAQCYLERYISAHEARNFTLVMKRYAVAKSSRSEGSSGSSGIFPSTT